MSFDALRHRLSAGRPLVIDSDPGASFRARGVTLDTPGTLGLLLRQRPMDVLDHYRSEVHSSVDVVSALTADTTPRALAEVGMQHRSAMLTGLAVELAQEAACAAPKPVAVAGLLGSEMVGPMAADRLHDELTEHAARLAYSGVELIIARGQGSRLGLMAAVVAAASTDLPTWAVLESVAVGELAQGEAMGPLLEALEDAGATGILLEVASAAAGVDQLSRIHVAGTGCAKGVLLATSAESVRGFTDPNSQPASWAERALDLAAAGARMIGGGAGSTEAHTAALAQVLGALHPSMPAHRSDTEIGGGPPIED